MFSFAVQYKLAFKEALFRFKNFSWLLEGFVLYK